MDLLTARDQFAYSDWADRLLLAAARTMDDERLDRPMEIGPGTLRRVMLHTLHGEAVWTRRWVGGRNGLPAEVPWPSETERSTIEQIEARFTEAWRERDVFLDSVAPAELLRIQTYRDSKGSLFSATLGEMITQSVVHSIHHRSQAVNMLRRLGAGLVELDYMMSRRKSAG
jgi:uncharacterized damage-inducible protein DinB